jgi:diadenosine tetraphosphate (Ap4A) HIT family hydrolase
MNLYESNNWTVVFGSWCQEFPGYCIISSKKETLSELTPEEWQELGLLEKELERITKKLFKPTMYNFACLMNNAYRDNEKPHVHFHFIPRYKEKVDLFGKIYNDKHFGYNFWKWALSRFKSQKDIFTKDERIKIYEMMKEEFKYE